jgi:DNA-binding transcriptional MerR regulator
MKQEEIKQISDLLRDAFGVFGKEQDKRFEKIEADIAGINHLMAEYFAQTNQKIDKIVEGMNTFAKMHDLADRRISDLEKEMRTEARRFGEMERRLATVERQLQIAQE